MVKKDELSNSSSLHFSLFFALKNCLHVSILIPFNSTPFFIVSHLQKSYPLALTLVAVPAGELGGAKLP
jgi:hypothetical protein